MKKILTLLCVAILGFTSSWGQQQWTGDNGGFNYTATMSMTPPTFGLVATLNYPVNKTQAEYELVTTVSGIGGLLTSCTVTTIATGAFTGMTADEVVVTLPASSTPLTLAGTYAATFGDNVKVYAPTAALQTAYNDVAAWNNKVLYESGENPHGTCGANLTWEFDPSASTLTIEGSGAMDNFTFNYQAYSAETPWKNYQTQFTSVVLPEGLTRVGNFAFYGSVITTLSLPSTTK